jgi:hypothetical protein
MRGRCAGKAATHDGAIAFERKQRTAHIVDA